MKKLSASYIVLFIHSILSGVLLGVFNMLFKETQSMITRDDYFSSYVAPSTGVKNMSDVTFIIIIAAVLLVFMVLTFTVFCLRLSACKELRRLNYGFVKQKKYYWLFFIFTVVQSLFVNFTRFIMYAIMLDKMQTNQSINFDSLRNVEFILLFVNIASTVFSCLIEYKLLKNIQFMAKGKEIGFRVLQIVWIIGLAFSFYRTGKIASAGFNNAENVFKTITAFRGEGSFFKMFNKMAEMMMSLMTYLVPNADLFSFERIIGYILAIAFIVCLVRTASMLKKQGLLIPYAFQVANQTLPSNNLTEEL